MNQLELAIHLVGSKQKTAIGFERLLQAFKSPVARLTFVLCDSINGTNSLAVVARIVSAFNG